MRPYQVRWELPKLNIAGRNASSALAREWYTYIDQPSEGAGVDNTWPGRRWWRIRGMQAPRPCWAVWKTHLAMHVFDLAVGGVTTRGVCGVVTGWEGASLTSHLSDLRVTECGRLLLATGAPPSTLPAVLGAMLQWQIHQLQLFKNEKKLRIRDLPAEYLLRIVSHAQYYYPDRQWTLTYLMISDAMRRECTKSPSASPPLLSDVSVQGHQSQQHGLPGNPIRRPSPGESYRQLREATPVTDTTRHAPPHSTSLRITAPPPQHGHWPVTRGIRGTDDDTMPVTLTPVIPRTGAVASPPPSRP